MDIDLLSKMVKELILDKDEVSLPGVGTFVAEIVPSIFSDKGYTINPPYKRLYFRQRETDDGNLLIRFYASNNNLDTETATRIIRDFLKEMKEILISKKIIIFPGLGKLRATKENNFFFIADEDLDIYPEGFGLEPISLKSHEETQAEVSATIATLRSILNPEEDKVQDLNPHISAGSEKPSVPEQHMDSETAANPETATDNQISSTSAENVTDSDILASPDIVTGPEETAVSETEVLSDKDSEDRTSEESIAVTSDSTIDTTPSSSTDEHIDTSLSLSESIQENQAEGTIDHIQETEVQAPEDNAPTMDSTSENIAGTQSGKESSSSVSTEEDEKKSIWLNIIKWLIITALIFILFIVAFVILAHIAPDFIDSILYTPEELEIIHS